jgi:hypothetical protein
MGLSVKDRFQIKQASAFGARDWKRIEELYFQYGNHLELTDCKHKPTLTSVMVVSIPHKPLIKMEV